jgi:hypothetical protein
LRHLRGQVGGIEIAAIVADKPADWTRRFRPLADGRRTNTQADLPNSGILPRASWLGSASEWCAEWLPLVELRLVGEVDEWFKSHAWKACLG